MLEEHSCLGKEPEVKIENGQELSPNEDLVWGCYLVIQFKSHVIYAWPFQGGISVVILSCNGVTFIIVFQLQWTYIF